MANYKIEFRRSVEKDLNRLSKQNQLHVMRRINALASDPRPDGCKKLSGQEPYRLRQGD